MRDLEQLQRWMQAVIMHPGGAPKGVASAAARQVIDVAPEEAEQVVARSQAQTGLERLDIYNRAYFARLLECLREEFPVLRHALEDELFDEFAIGYLEKYPSRSYTLNQLGLKFPGYLEESRPEGETWPEFLIDLATLELTYNEVFDGPGVEGDKLLQVEQLLAIPPERWPEARLLPVPCLRLHSLRYPVHKYFDAVRKKKKATLPKPRPTFLAVTRRDYVVHRYEVSRLEHVLLGALVKGQAVGEAIALAAESAGPDLDQLAARLREWFSDWTRAGFFQAVKLPD